MLTPVQYREKHARNLKNSTEDIRIGVANVSVAPAQSAIKALPKMKANLIKSIDDGTVQRGLEKVTLTDWQKSTTEVGIPRIAAGIDAAATSVEDFATQFLPVADAVSKKVASMPNMTIDDSINRATTAIRELAKFRKK